MKFHPVTEEMCLSWPAVYFPQVAMESMVFVAGFSTEAGNWSHLLIPIISHLDREPWQTPPQLYSVYYVCPFSLPPNE